MKLATLKDDSRDGCLVVVSRDLKIAVKISEISKTLQYALDNWEGISPQLEEIYSKLNAGMLSNTFDFVDSVNCAAPLPRAYQWLDGSAYVNHVELVRKARNVEIPESFWTDPLMYQGASDTFIGPNEPIEMGSEDWGIDCEAEIAIITDDVPMGVSVEAAPQHIKLLMLVNDVSLRNLIPAELKKGFGFVQSKPTSSFSPVAVTPDEIGNAWLESKVHLPLITQINDTPFGHPNAGVDMTFNFAQLVAHAAKSRYLSAGTIIGSGTVSNKDTSVGSSCLAEKRVLEIIEHGAPVTPFLRYGDRVRIEMTDGDGQSIFGAIDQKVSPYSPSKKVT